MNTAQQISTSMESLVALAGMTAFSDDCDRLVKRVPAPAIDRGAESEAQQAGSGA